jgi:hypothetical protein
MCRCAIIGDPLVVFFDQSVALLLKENNYIVAFVGYNVTRYPCSFVFFVRTRQRNGLIISEGIQLIVKQSGPATTIFVTQDGVWVSQYGRRCKWARIFVTLQVNSSVVYAPKSEKFLLCVFNIIVTSNNI